MQAGTEGTGWTGSYVDDDEHDDDDELMADEESAAEVDDEGAPDEPQGERWQELVAMWRDLPDPEWDQARADRVFQNIMQSLDRRERRRRMAWMAACAFVPFIGAAWLGSRMRS